MSASIANDGQTTCSAVIPFAAGLSTANFLRFPATQVPSAGVNDLDDYEESTWTPADGSGAGLSLTVTDATYIKVGQQVTVSARITYPVTASGSNASISGLPFTSRNGTSSNFGGAPSYTDANVALSLLVAKNTTRIDLMGIDGLNKTNANVSAKVLAFCITYFATA